MLEKETLQKIANKLNGTSDSPDQICEDILGYPCDEDWDNVLLDFDIQQCDQCGVWQGIEVCQLPPSNFVRSAT